jgi:hypothetical protein
MKTGVRLLAVVVSLLTLLAGPLAPLVAAQQPPPAQPEPAPQAQAPQPMPEPTITPLPPQRMPEPTTTPLPPQSVPEPGPAESRIGEAVAYNVGAGIANVFFIPGKGLLCGAGVASGVIVMLFSIGSAPRTAAYFAREECGGRWILTGDDLRPEADVRAFDWERDGTPKY